jgi:phenylacetate-CoA ligase
MVATRGLTGLPLVFILSQGDLDRLAFNGALAFNAIGLTGEDRVQILLTLDALLIAGMSYYRGLNALGINTSRIGHIPFEKQKHYIELLKPTVLLGTPSYLKVFGQRLVESGFDLPNSSIEKIFCVGESIRNEALELNNMGKTVHELFNAQLFSGYGVTEFSVSYCECSEQNGCHAHPELILTEIVDEDGNPVPDGTVGELVGTPLGVEGVPLLRYRTGDITFKLSGTCSCGRNSDRIGPILKRKSQIIKLKDKTVYPLAITGALDELDYIQDYVLMIEGKESFPDQATLHIVAPVTRLDSITAHLREKAQLSIPILISNSATINSFRGGTRREVKIIDKRNQ